MAEFLNVTKERFFATVGRLNVHPSPKREVTEWVMQDGTRAVVGLSTPGYANTWTNKGKTPETYSMAAHLVPAA